MRFFDRDLLYNSSRKGVLPLIFSLKEEEEDGDDDDDDDDDEDDDVDHLCPAVQKCQAVLERAFPVPNRFRRAHGLKKTKPNTPSPRN